MDTVFVTLLIVVIVLLAVNFFIIFNFLKSKKEGSEAEKNAMQSNTQILMQQMNEITRQLSDQTKHLNDSSRNQTTDIQKSIDAINRKVTDHLIEVTKGVTESNTATKQIFTVAEQLQNLEKVLKHSKQRGAMGEASLELILGNILPPTAYQMQYQFKDSAMVDAIINTKEGFIPVDAKFSLDNYNRLVNENDDLRREELEKEFSDDLKKRINETAKYIRPEQGTLPFAFMFIPAEGIYYDLLVNQIAGRSSNSRNILDYAYNDKKVVIVSPTTFAAYLQSVLYGFKAFKIEESAQEIRKYVIELQKHLKNYEEYHNKLGKNLDTVVNHYNSSSKAFRQIDRDVLKITGDKIGIEAPEVLKTADED